jgi:two-component system chemotaxis response regulator CheB
MTPPTSRTPLRVLVADDSALARSLIRACLEHDRDIEIIGEAANGLEAIELVEKLRPHLLTLDLHMPQLGGLDAIERIMSRRALPILVITSTDDAAIAGEAILRGALDVTAKPSYDDVGTSLLAARVRLLAKVPVITRSFRLDPQSPATGTAASTPCLSASSADRRVVAIASSTGGPQALAAILPKLPASFCAPVLIAQHISDGFAEGMADWLAGLCALPVVLARDGAPIEAGHIYVAPAERNLVVTTAHRLALVERAASELHRPSCDALLNSVSRVFGAAAIGVILSGMGRDGAAGMAALRQAGAVTIAQDEASSVVFGMNQVAIERGAVQRVLPVNAIGDELVALLARRRPT